MGNAWNPSTYNPSVSQQFIVVDTAPNITLTGTTSATLLLGYTIPGTVFQGNDVLQVDIIWSCNNTANQKEIALNFNGTTTILDAQTSKYGAMDTWYILPNNHSTSNQNNYGTAYPGPLTAANVTSTNNMTGDTYAGIYGLLNTSTDNLSISFLRLSVWQDRTPTNLLYQGQGKKLFYGTNVHYNSGYTPAQIVTSMTTIGCTLCRMTYENYAPSLAALVALAQAFQGTNNSIYCCIDLSAINDAGAIWPGEQAAYQYGFTTGFNVATTLIPLGVTLYECGNELDTKNGINPSVTTGQFVTDFTGQSNGLYWFNIVRGMMRGCIAGVHAAAAALNTTAYAGSNATTVSGIGFLGGMWYGYSPDGTTNNPPVRWDFSAFHNYRVYGSLFANQGNTGTNTFLNTIEWMWRNFNVPIFISEFNGNAGDTDAQRAAYVTQEFPRFLQHRKQWGIQGVMIYSSFDSPYNVLTNPTTLESTLGTTYNAFITANPDPGT